MNNNDIQRLPREFHAISRKDRGTYAVWYDGNGWKAKQMPDPESALSFVRRAEERKFPAYCTTFWNGENKVFEFSPYGPLQKYAFKDIVVLEIKSIAARMRQEEAGRIARASSNRSVEQLGRAEYKALFPEIEDVSYEVSWYDTETDKHIFRKQTFADLPDARSFFESMEAPCRLVELCGFDLHEIAARNQHWYIGQGNYAEQMVEGTLPVGELPYFFHNRYSVDQLEVETLDGKKYGTMHLYSGGSLMSNNRKDFLLMLDGTEEKCHVMLNKYPLTLDSMYDVYVIKNPIFAPWFARIRGRYLGGAIL